MFAELDDLIKQNRTDLKTKLKAYIMKTENNATAATTQNVNTCRHSPTTVQLKARYTYL